MTARNTRMRTSKIDTELDNAVVEYLERVQRPYQYGVMRALYRMLKAEAPELLKKHKVEDRWP